MGDALITLSQLLVAWGLHTLTIWVWHLPDFYQAALESEWIHVLEHTLFLGTGLLFWAVILRPGYGIGVLSLFTLTLHSTLLSALITFAPWPWYTHYLDTAPLWHLTPLEDQQLAGVLMWIPAGLVYTLAALILFTAWLAKIDQPRAMSHK
jgi:putative membrane protein